MNFRPQKLPNLIASLFWFKELYRDCHMAKKHANFISHHVRLILLSLQLALNQPMNAHMQMTLRW